MRNKLSEKEAWERIEAETHAHALRQRAHHIFKDSDIGALAKKPLEPTELLLKEMNDRQRSYLVCDLRDRLENIATLADLRSTRSPNFGKPGIE
jgi:hypothetical protein